MEIFKKAIYIVVIGLLAIFLLKQGEEPWVIALRHWQVLFQVMIFTGIGLVIQAQSFKSVAPPETKLDLTNLTLIWAASAVTSVVAPLFAGIATRTILLKRIGFSLSNCLITSGRQIWMGLELALLLASISLFFIGIPHSKSLAAAMLASWLSMLITRVTIAKRAASTLNNPTNEFKKIATALAHPIKRQAYFWFALQILLMSSIYYTAFNGMGGKLSISEATALSSLTVLLSLFFFVPNGLGVTDMIWVWVATQTGLTLDSAVGLAILIRLAHLISSGMLYGLTKIYTSSSKPLTEIKAGE